MPRSLADIINSFRENFIDVPNAIEETRGHIHRRLASGTTTQKVVAKFIDRLKEAQSTYDEQKNRNPTDREVKELKHKLLDTLREIKKAFDEESSEAMKALANQSQVGDFPESSAPSAGSSHQSQYYGSHYNHPQPSSHPASQKTNRHEQNNPTLGQYETRHNPHQPPSLQRFSFEESHMQEQSHTNPAQLNRHILSPQELRGTAGGSHEQNLQKSSNVQSQSTQSGKRKEDNTSDGRDDLVQRFPYGHRTRDSVNTFGIPHQASRIDPTASSTGHAGQSTESFSSSRTPSSNYTYDGRQSEGSSSRQGSTRSRRSTESQIPSSSGSGGGHDNSGPVPRTSYPAQSAYHPSQPGPSQMQVRPSPYYPQPGPSSSTSGPSGYPDYPAYPQGPTQAGPFVPDDDEDLYDPGYSMPKAGPPPGQGRGRRGGHR